MRVILSRQEVGEGVRPPYGYGCAYYDIFRKTQVFYPIGIHWLVMFGRGLMFLYWRTVWWRPKAQRKFESRLRRAIHSGYSRGYSHEFERGKLVAKKEYDRGFKAGFFMHGLVNEAQQIPAATSEPEEDE